MPRHPDAAVNNKQAINHENDTLRLCHRENPTKEVCVDWSMGVVYGVRRNGVCGHSHTERTLRNTSLLERLSVSKFPFRHPVLHGLLLELRSFRHRIQRLWQQGGTRFLETGPVYQQKGPLSHLVLNRQTQLRTQADTTPHSGHTTFTVGMSLAVRRGLPSISDGLE
jgi:hypothetical protein